MLHIFLLYAVASCPSAGTIAAPSPHDLHRASQVRWIPYQLYSTKNVPPSNINFASYSFRRRRQLHRPSQARITVKLRKN